jgi:hypothetical protein
MGVSFCRKCGAALSADSAFCPKCGTVVAIAPIPPPAVPVQSPAAAFAGNLVSARPRRGVVIAVAVAVVLLLVLVAFVWGYYLPSQNYVRTGGGNWTIVGSPPVPATAACSDCGHSMVSPGSVITIHISVYAGVGTCTFFDCPSLEVTGISVGAPYVIVSANPNTLPVYIPQSQSYSWALNVQAPGSAGHDPLSGSVSTA